MKYTNKARDSGKSTITGKGTWQHSKAYTVFKEKIIVNKLVKKGKALRMTRLTELLTETAKEVENRDIHVKPYALKCKLQRDFPQLIFIQSRAQNQSLFSKIVTCKSDHSLPPNGHCLALHAQRANYQAAI